MTFYGTSEKNLIQLGKNAAVEKNGNTIIMSEYKNIEEHNQLFSRSMFVDRIKIWRIIC